jgi:LacI family transcriptional regulator
MVFELMRARHVDGFVLATATTHNRVLAEAAQAGLLVVLVNRLSEEFSFPSVSVDNERGIRLAVGHLTGLGHRRIAHVAGPQDTSTGRERLRGFQAALAGAGLAADPALITHAAGFVIEEGYRCTRELLGRGNGAAGPVCTAIAAGNDMLAIGCYKAIEEAGLSCPQDVSVIGFNDMPFIDRLRPPLSTIAFPHYQVGTEAAQLLLERLAGDERPVRSLYLAPDLVVRGSTAPPRPGG